MNAGAPWEDVEKTLPRLYRTAVVLTGDPARAEDLVQDVAVAALSSICQFRSDADLSTWLTSILLNKYRMIRRSDAARTRNAPGLAAAVKRPGDESEEACELLRGAIGRLDSEKRTLIALCIYNELTSAEAGGLLGLPAGTVRSKLYEAREELRALLKEKLGYEVRA